MNKKVLFVNVTRQCNVNCPRCYLTEEKRNTKECIPIEYIIKALEDEFYSDQSENVILSWLGGELTLVGEEVLTDYMSQVASKFPFVEQAIVTNCLNMPDWLISLCHKYTDSHFETTYALGNKFTLDGSSDKYQEKFLRSIKKAQSNGLTVAINVELNRETFDSGTDALMEVIRDSNVKTWEFDISADFKQFLQSPSYNMYKYPILPATITYEQYSDFIINLVERHGEELEELGVYSSIIWQTQNLQSTQFFGVKMSDNMFTINADGGITSNVLWSDLSEMIIGNIKNDTISNLLSHPVRRLNTRWETIHRVKTCSTCKYFRRCQGGSSHVPLYDGVSDECAGGKKIYEYMSNHYKGNFNPGAHKVDPRQ